MRIVIFKNAWIKIRVIAFKRNTTDGITTENSKYYEE